MLHYVHHLAPNFVCMSFGFKLQLNKAVLGFKKNIEVAAVKAK